MNFNTSIQLHNIDNCLRALRLVVDSGFKEALKSTSAEDAET